MTTEQRRSIENGIWLCQVCAKLIDSDKDRYTAEVLGDWRDTAEHFARQELSTNSSSHVPPSNDQIHSIRVAVENWGMWRERGTLPGDPVVFISIWARGNVRYSFTLRLRNDLGEEDNLKRVRIEFHEGDQIVFSDEYAIQPDEIVLPARKWITQQVDHGLYDDSVFLKARTVWLSAETVGDNQVFRWKIADYDPHDVKPPDSK
jgi:hypothetical protein